MGWRILQISIYLATVLAAFAAIFHWGWMRSAGLAGWLGIGLAWFATVVLSEMFDRGPLAGLLVALKVPWRIISAVFVAMFIAPFQALRRWAKSEDRSAARLPRPQQSEALCARIASEPDR